MSKVMLINATEEEESRVAIVEGNQLIDFNYEICSREQSRGNIFKGVVTKVEPSLQAAFVDYGAERAGFLPVGEVRKQAMSGKPKDGKRPRIEEILKKRQEIMVQVVKEGIGTKGAALSTKIAIPGRYLVIMPGDRAGGVSRKIADEGQRKKAKDILSQLDVQDDMGIIIRTAGMDRTQSEIQKDFMYLEKLWNTVMENYMKAKAPAMVYQESDVILRSIRDYFTPDVTEIVTDSPEAFERIFAFVSAVMPNYLNRVRLYESDRPLFDHYRIEDQIDRLHEQRVRLKSGGEIVITQTEALVAIDVNSGKSTGEKSAELTAYKTNCEAAEEIARQLRLRDLGGLIVCDFIDMRDGKHVRGVEKTMRGALRKDKARIETTHISKLGLLEISRQRLKKSVYTTSFSPCSNCNGTGVVRSIETLALSVLRHIQSRVALGDIAFVRGDLPAEVLVYLLNAKRDELVRLQNSNEVKIQLNIRPERQGLGARLSSNPADWLEFHRRLRDPSRKPQQAAATVEDAVRATEAARKEMEEKSREAAEEARRNGEPQVVIDAILSGEDPETVRRRLMEEENRKVRQQIKSKGGKAKKVGVTKLPPVSVDESAAIEGIVLGPGGTVEAATVDIEVEDDDEPQPRSNRSERGRDRDRDRGRGRSRGRGRGGRGDRKDHRRPPREEDGDGLDGFVLTSDGSLKPASTDDGDERSGRGGGGGRGDQDDQDDFNGSDDGRKRRRRRRRGKGGGGGDQGERKGSDSGPPDSVQAFEGIPLSTK